MEKKSKFTGIANAALLTSVLVFPGCDLAKPKNKEINTPQAEPVAEVVDAPRPPPPTVTPQRQTQAQNSPAPTTSHQATMQQAQQLVTPSGPTPPRATTHTRQANLTARPTGPAAIAALQTERQAALLGPMPAELPPGWTAEKYNTLAKFREERLSTGDWGGKLFTNDIKDIAPILISRNLVFSPEWLDLVGNGKSLPRQQFADWLGRLDKVYDAYEDLIGSKPKNTEKTFVNLMPSGSEHGPAYATGSSSIHISKNYIIRPEPLGSLKSGGITYTIPHEMAHTFMSGKPLNVRNVTDEAMSELLTAYAMESLDMHYGISGRPRGTMSLAGIALTKGAGHRKQGFHIANLGRQNNTISPFPKTGNTHDPNTVNAFYLFGMVDTAGLDAYKEAFRSYNDPNFTPNYRYSGGGSIDAINMRDFFDRIAHF